MTAPETASSYTAHVRAELARIGAADTCPSCVEGWLRVTHGTLDGLSTARFASDVRGASHMVRMRPEHSKRVARCYGLDCDHSIGGEG